MISKGNPTYFFERNRLVRSLERVEFRTVSISAICVSIFLQTPIRQKQVAVHVGDSQKGAACDVEIMTLGALVDALQTDAAEDQRLYLYDYALP